MLAIGRSVFRPRLHSSLPVAAFSTAADCAPTPPGPAVMGPVMGPVMGTALAAGAAAVSAAHAARTAPTRVLLVTRIIGWTRAGMDTPAE
jgi:hypothetical protein